MLLVIDSKSFIRLTYFKHFMCNTDVRGRERESGLQFIVSVFDCIQDEWASFKVRGVVFEGNLSV